MSIRQFMFNMSCGKGPGLMVSAIGGIEPVVENVKHAQGNTVSAHIAYAELFVKGGGRDFICSVVVSLLT